jgi:heavy metal sensor kinase
LSKISISLRLTLWFTAIFFCGFAILGGAMWLGWSYTLASGRDRTLTRRAARAYEVLANYSAKPAAALSHRYDEFVEATPEGNLIHVIDANGRLLLPEASAAPADFPWPRLPKTPEDRIENVWFRGREYRVFQHHVKLGSQPLLIVVSGQLEDNRQMLAQFTAGLLETIPILLAATALAGYFMSRRALKPVDRLTSAVRSLSIGNLSERLPISHTGDELQRLAETCNEMLARLETAVAQIKRFTADASHELRSPLSYIRMVSESALRDSNLQPEIREIFTEILEECCETARLLEDMLLLARADAGNVDIPFETTDLSALVRDSLERARVPAASKRHQLTLHCANGPCEIRGDRSILRRLIWTLLDNAIKYTPEGGRVDVLLEKSGAQARLRFSDTGIGIPRHLLPRVFDRFFRADPSRSQEGAGLGLAIAKWIADVHRAELTVESEFGVGSAFTVIFPLDCNENRSVRQHTVAPT